MKTTYVLELYGFAMTQKAAEIGEQFSVAQMVPNAHMEAQYLLVNNCIQV